MSNVNVQGSIQNVDSLSNSFPQTSPLNKQTTHTWYVTATTLCDTCDWHGSNLANEALTTPLVAHCNEAESTGNLTFHLARPISYISVLYSKTSQQAVGWSVLGKASNSPHPFSRTDIIMGLSLISSLSPVASKEATNASSIFPAL